MSVRASFGSGEGSNAKKTPTPRSCRRAISSSSSCLIVDVADAFEFRLKRFGAALLDDRFVHARLVKTADLLIDSAPVLVRFGVLQNSRSAV